MQAFQHQGEGQPNLRELWRGGRWAVARTYRTEPKLCTSLLVVAVINALVPAGVALALGRFADALKDTTDHPEAALLPAIHWLGATIGLTFFGAIAAVVRNYCQDLLADEMHLDLSQEMLEHADTLDVAQFEDPGVQDILSRATQNPGRDFTLFFIGMIDTTAMTLTILCLLGVLFWIDPLVTPLLVLASFPLTIHRWRMAKKQYGVNRAKTTSRRWSRYYFSQLTTLPQVLSSKMLNLSPVMISRFRDLYLDIIGSLRKLYIVRAIGQTIAALVSLIILFSAVTWVALRATDLSASMGIIVTYGLAAFQLVRSFEILSRSVANTLEHSLFISNLTEFLNVEPSIDTSATVQPTNFIGEIVLEDVSFTYPGATTPALSNVSFRIAPGETIAVVGHSGSGKTTLIQLIARFYDVTSGRILIDGTDIRELPVRQLRSQLACVFQARTTYEATARENIAYGDWPRLMDDPEAVRRIAAEAGAEEFINGLPDGFDTHLGRRFGMFTLSGGQWQRLAIARALARRNAILVLDEPTADLDVTAERDLFHSIRELASNRTAVLISHRFSTVHIADRIAVLNRGQLVEQGTHEQLIDQDGFYGEWYRTYWGNQGRTPEPS